MYRAFVTFHSSLNASFERYAEFSEALIREFGANVVDEIEEQRCIFLFRNSDLTEDDIRKILTDAFSSVFQNGEPSQYMITDIRKVVSGEKAPIPPCMKDIESLLGAEQFKVLAKEMVSIAPSIAYHDTYKAFAFRSYLFSINDGCGYSTYLNLLSLLIKQTYLFAFEDSRRVVELKLLPPSVEKVDPFCPVTDYLRRYGHPGGMLLSIDISEWISEVSSPRFRKFLSFLEDYTEHNIFVFRVPFLENEILSDVHAALKDILYIRPVAFPPMSMEQLTECADRILSGYGFSASEDAYAVFTARVQEEKSDGRFYGINTVNKIICEMIYRKHLHDARTGTQDSVIHAEDISGLSSGYSISSGSISDLEQLVGLECVKQTVDEIVSQIEFALRQNRDRPCIHMRFVGNPGTGKTTMARILGRILKERGILRHGHFFEYSGRDFCGRYIGETAPKTTAMCRDAYGSVLFIDEAYSLYRGEDEGRDFGREALDTLISEMENHRNDLVVIMAGYPDEMDRLLQANPGLESRMPYLIEFPNYTREQLYRIFFKLVGDSFSYDAEFESAVREYFDSIPDEVLNSKKFSNARFVRNLFERTCAKAGTRRQFEGDGPVSLTKEDFRLAGADSSFRTLVEKRNRSKIGF